MKQILLASQLEAALRHHRSGEHEQAEALYRGIIDSEPRNAEALQYAGFLALQTGRFEIAVERLRRAIRSGNDLAGTHLLLGRAYKGAGRIDSAIASYRRAIALDNTLVDAYVSLGIAYRANGQTDDAARTYAKALTLNRDSFEAHLNLANLLQDTDQAERAVGHYEQAQRLRPGSGEVHCRYGTALQRLGRKSEAAEQFDRAIVCDPDLLDAHLSLGNLLNVMKQHAAAATYFESLLARLESPNERPEGSATRHELYRDARLGRIDALIGDLHYEEARQEIERDLRDAPDSVPLLDRMLLIAPYRVTSQAEIVALLRRFQRVSPYAAVQALEPSAQHAGTERLRIGYVSGDLREHSVAYFLEPLLASHDRSTFTAVCYSSNEKDDDTTARLRGYVDEWIEAKSLTDLELARRVTDDRIDVLVDLSGRTGGTRFGMFAYHPATVQVGFLGFPTYTGLHQLEFRVTDAVIDPDGTNDDALATERPLRLPHSMFCYRPPSDAPDVTVRRPESEGAVRFGSFNQAPKLGPAVLGAWIEILQRVPDAVLVLKAFAFDDDSTRSRFLDSFVQAGIDGARVQIRASESKRDRHLAAYGEIDIALDTFPYNGATTTCEALWMGVPVVSLCGETHSCRMGASLLGAMGLDELLATSVNEYVDVAVALAADPLRRAQLRGTLRARFERSALRDEAGFTRNFETTLRRAWQEQRAATRAARET